MATVTPDSSSTLHSVAEVTTSSLLGLQYDEDLLSDVAENDTSSNIFKDIKKFATNIAEEIKNDPNYSYVFISVAMVLLWAVYIILYNSRVQGKILTTVLRRFIKKGDITIGSFSISLLWGKLLFRDVVYVTEDYNFRVVDAIVQFHYWLPYLKRELSEDMSRCDHRLWVELNGPELHIYNRSDVYCKLEEYFGLDPKIISKASKEDIVDSAGVANDTFASDLSYWNSWRDLIPVIKVDFNMARFVFGNKLIPSTLILTMDKAESVYSTKPASASCDHFMHIVKSNAENFRVILAPSPKYTGTLDEPPRYMGEGFVVLSSSKIQFYYYMDEPGLVPELQNMLLPNEENDTPPPVWGLDVKCEKGTNLSYGPWADRQREQLFKFFFPQDFQVMEVDGPQPSGEVRKVRQFDLRLTMLTEATIDILFSKENETSAVHMTVQKGSYFELTLPYAVSTDGYTMDIKGQLLYLEASTSLQYRSLLEAESFKYEICIKYPRVWNHQQLWHMDFSGVKVSYHFLYIHKEFFHNLIEDWASTAQPDVVHFVPYTWKFTFGFKHFELITLANEYNWVDCSSQHLANSHVAFCGDALQLSFFLPFTEFLPEAVALKFSLVAKKVNLSLYLPPSYTTRNILSSLDGNGKLHNSRSRKVFAKENWRRFCKLSSDWIDCWCVPEVELVIGYIYHPAPPLGPSPQANVSTPEKVELLLSPIRAPKRKRSPVSSHKMHTIENFDATTLAADSFSVELKILQPSEIKLYGTILRLFIHLKENIFGEDQKFIDMSQQSPYAEEPVSNNSMKIKMETEEKKKDFDERKFRPFEVTVNINIRRVKGHLMKDCGESEPTCPTIELDHLAFEMKKQYHETQMQVLLSPVILTTFDQGARHPHHGHLQEGFLLLSGFQMRGHAMFSDEGLRPWDETLEYAWLVELSLGSLSGKLTAPQLQHLITGLETFVSMAVDSENCLRHPRPYHLCYHGDPQPDCSYTLPDHFCPSLDVIKYKMIRTSIDALDFHLVEAGSDLNLQVYPIRIATCNLHGQHTRSGITAHIQNIRLKNSVCGWVGTSDPQDSSGGKGSGGISMGSLSGVGCNTSGSTGTGGRCGSQLSDVWVEAASLILGPLFVDAAVSSNMLHHDMQLIQHKLLKLHDQKTKRLWFFWPNEVTKVNSEVFGKCGCVGGCFFFGTNRNGPRFFKPSSLDFTEGLNVAQFRINEPSTSPGYGQSILLKGQLIFDTHAYSCLVHCLYEASMAADEGKHSLSSGYFKTTSPTVQTEGRDPHGSRSSSRQQQQSGECVIDPGRLFAKTSNPKQAILERHASEDHDVLSVQLRDPPKAKKYSGSGLCQRLMGESNSLGRPVKDSAGLAVPAGDGIVAPGSLTDLHLSADNVSAASHACKKMSSSLSLQTEFTLSNGRQQRSSVSSRGETSNSVTSRESPPDPYTAVHRTISVGSEALSEAFYSADEDQVCGAMTSVRRATSISPTSSQVSLPTVPEIGAESDLIKAQLHSSFNASRLAHQDELSTNGITKDKYADAISGSSSSLSSRRSSATSTSSGSNSSHTETCDYLSRSPGGHSQTSLLHSSNSDEDASGPEDPINEILRKRSRRSKSHRDEYFSEIGSISSTSFLSAVSSQDEAALVDLHMQLNKPITESPLLMTSYINHMTQLKCNNWNAPLPAFEKGKYSGPPKLYAPTFDKISEGFTDIRMIEGKKSLAMPKSPPLGSYSNHTPSHPYAWDTPIFTWGEENDTLHDEPDEVIGGMFDSNTTRTTVVMKLKKDVDLMISPIALESAQRYIESLTPVMEALHPLTVVNHAHFRSLGAVEGKNTLKKDRYMYWSRLQDTKTSGTPEQAAVVTHTYQESCFLQIQGQITVPRVNVTLLQASVVEEIISFSALDNIRDLTCVSLFCFCLDGVHLQFYSGHQSKKSVQILMRNPKVSGKPKKGKWKTKQNVDLLTEPVYIETSERQQEENMISVSVNKLHVQLRRLRNESSLLKDASITAIPNHRSKVLFNFGICNRGEERIVDEGLPTTNGGSPSGQLEEERMGFIMCEAGLENVALKAIKRKGFGNSAEGSGKSTAAPSGGSTSHATPGGVRRDSSLPAQNPSMGSGDLHQGKGGAVRTHSAPPTNARRDRNNSSSHAADPSGQQSEEGSPSAPATAPPNISTPFNLRKAGGHLDKNEHPIEVSTSASPSQASTTTGHSAGIPAYSSTKNSIKDESQGQTQNKCAKKDITSFITELKGVWFNFAAPPHAPITRKIDYTRLDWNLLSTASPSINAWMNPSDRLTVAVIQFLHSSERRRLGVMASLMAEALDVQSLHVPPKNKYSKLMPLSQTLQEDPSCQLCNVLRRYVLAATLEGIESNLTYDHMPKLATLRQAVVVLMRQWKNALYMPLLMEQTFKYKQAHPAYSFRSTSGALPTASFSSHQQKTQSDFHKILEEKTSLLNDRDSPLSNIEEDPSGNDKKQTSHPSEDFGTDGVISSGSSNLPPRHSLPSFPPRSSTASAIIPPMIASHDTPARFHLRKFGDMFEGTLNFFRGSAHQTQTAGPDSTKKSRFQGSLGRNIPGELPENVFIPIDDKYVGKGSSGSPSLVSGQEDAEMKDFLPPRLPREDLQRWMNNQHEHNSHGSQSTRPTVTFNKGLDLPTLSEDIEVDEQDSDSDATSPLKKQSIIVIQEPQQAHFLEAHVIFDPLLSAIGVIAQQVTGGALEQLGANISVTGNVDTLRVDIIESEASRLSRKKRKSAHQQGKFFLDISSGLPAFLCEKVGLEIDISKVADESRGLAGLQPTLFVSRSALRHHTSTMVHFSLNVDYIAQQVNMPLLRLLHQISSMYQNARQTQIGLKEQRPSKTTNADIIPPRLRNKDSLSDVHDTEYKGAEYSLSLSEEQGTLSSLGGCASGFHAQRDSVVSSSSARAGSPLLPSASVQMPASGTALTHGHVSSTSRSVRPQSFAQRLRSSTKMGKGYRNFVLEKERAAASSPLLSVSPSGSPIDGGTVCSDKSPLLGPADPLLAASAPAPAPATPKCWRNVYYLVDLYATTPETKTVLQRTVIVDHPDRQKTSLKYDLLKESKSEDVEAAQHEVIAPVEETSILTAKPKDFGYFGLERTPLVIFGLAKIQRTKLLATLSGLKLEAEMNAMHSSITFREKVRGTRSHRSTSEMSLTGHIGSTMIVLLEGIAPNQQTVVRVTINKSQGLYSSLSRKSKDKNSALITIGPIQIDIPQHPIILHDMMTRGTKQLSSTLQELRVTRPPRLSRGATVDEPDTVPSPRPLQNKSPEPVEVSAGADTLLHPLAIQFSILLQELSIHAALLPSLQATYCMQQVSSLGTTGAKAKFTIHLPSHHLAFSTKLQDLPAESSLPPSAKISLPQVHVEAEYLQDDSHNLEQRSDGMVLREGSYLSAVAEIGALEHSLTTDLLNHLVFVQKVFMKEVNEVVQKMAGSDKPVPLWSEEGSNVTLAPQRLLFTIQITLKGIIITATTPTQSAVRLETGSFELQLSNRVENVGQPSSTSASKNANVKLFGKAQVDISLALGQLIRNELFDEVEPELQQLAYFKTRICLRNAFHNELASIGDEGEVVLITLTRPLICIQPLAVDRAVLVWLNYKNAYEYWNEQRATLNKEVLAATQQVFEKVPQLSSLSSAAHIKSKLFLQLTVCDIGVCLPINPCRTISHQVESTESKDALVVTLDSTIISACNSGSLVCKAHFNGFCLRFAPDFETSLDEWKPDYRDPCIMNLCRVSEGTYEVCSRTVAQNPDKGDNAKWLLNVQWQMEGVDLHLDVNIGKHLSSLARTLTMLTSAPEPTIPTTDFDSDEGENADHTPQESTSLPAFLLDHHIDARQRAKLLENEMNEQAKTVNDLKTLGASASTIEQEMRRLKELEQIISNDFRRDMLMKIRRQSIKATSMKDRLGLGPKIQIRSKSIRVPSPTVEVKEPATRHASIASGSTDSGHTDDADTGEVFVTVSEETVHPGETQTPTPTNTASDTETDTITNTNLSNDHIQEETAEFEENILPPQNQYGFGLPPTGGVSQGSSLPPSYKPQDPSIDLELDVKVSINSGECILYNKNFCKDDETKSKMKKDRSFSGGIYDVPSSPGSVRKRVDLRPPSTGKLKQSGQSTPSVASESTGFFIPGLDVKVHYASHDVYEDTPASGSKPGEPLSTAISPCKGFPSFPQSQPTQVNYLHATRVLSPRGLSPTPPPPPPPPPHSESHMNLSSSRGCTSPVTKEGSQSNFGTKPQSRPCGLPAFASGTPGTSNLRPGRKKASLFTWMTLQSIPDETMISPIILDFLEKVLQPIPLTEMSKSDTFSALESEPELVYNVDGDSSLSGPNSSGGYASFPVDVIVYFHMQPSTIRFSCQPVSRVECLLKLPSLNVVFSSKRTDERGLFSQENGKFPIAMGGLSVTGALEDFSLFVFHPYGGKHKGSSSTHYINESERKDSLSVTVGFVKFHLARSRKIHLKQDQTLQKHSKGGGSNASATKAIIRFSTIVDIGKALFKYDMRRLTEILAFPRAWYRRTIVRKLFLGDMTSRVTLADQEEVLGFPDATNCPQTNSKRQSASSSDTNDSPHWDNRSSCSSSPAASTAGDSATTQCKTDKGSPDHERSPRNTTGVKMKSDSWETLVQFVVNFTELNVHMNMGNVMGNVVWTTKDFKSNGRLSIGSTGHKNMYIGLGLGSSTLEAKGGIVGGTIELSEINVYSKIREDPGTEPDHVIGIKLFASQSRLDYMGTSVLMTRVSSFSVTVKDEWKLKQCAKDDEDTTRRGATIFILGDIEWDQLQLLISKSTTADLLKMHHKLEEFFTQQFKSSKRIFSSLQPARSKSSSFKYKERAREAGRKMASALGVNVGPDPRHHRHWQNVLSKVSGLRLSTLPLPLPVVGTVLGGSFELHGKTIFLACFHGMNFKSKSWALFSLKEPYINFTSEVQEVPNEPARDTHIVQNLTFSLGVMEQAYAQHVSMAKVSRITRTMVFPPQFRTLQEWFFYAFCTSDLDDVDRFPSLDSNKTDSLNSTSSADAKRSSPRLHEHNHSTETIFALPSMEINLNTKHLQTPLAPEFTDEKPKVDCAFVTDFQDHIFVTVDAENFFFLHDLINSYIKDTKEKLGCESDSRSDDRKSKSIKVNEATQILQQDWREFTCDTWHLEPTVRLLSWATRNLESYGVDYILNKLGFSHASTTIPKWLQRGCMDPLDKVLSLLMHRMITAIHEHDAANR